MTTPHVSAPPRLGSAARSSAVAAAGRVAARRPSRPARSMRDLTPFILLAMILIPSLIILGLAIADPGVPQTGIDAPQAVTAAPGS